MIVYKIYNFPTFENVHKDYFNSLLEIIKQNNFLSPAVDEIIITDDFENEITRYCENHIQGFNLTKSREYSVVAKTIDFDGKKKIFLDATKVNIYIKFTQQIFFGQLIEIYAEDVISNNYKVPNSFLSSTPFTEVVGICFSQWATKVVANVSETSLVFQKNYLHDNIKIFVNEFKRNIRKLHYKHQEDRLLNDFWINSILEVDNFIRRCLDVKFDNGNFDALQEFNEIIPSLLSEIEIQTQYVLVKEQIDISSIRKYVLEILNKCSINIPSENPMCVKVMETPKKLFKGNLVDTEPRLVAFIDILGFSDIISEYDSIETSNILNELHDTLETAIKVSIEGLTKPDAVTDLKDYLEYRMFSDCICISLPYIEYENDFHIQFHSLSYIVRAYQLAMLQKGFFVRGGISMGSFYSDKNMIFSGGLVNAYKLEQIAIYPIIIVDKKVLERLKNNFKENSKNLFYENTMLYKENDPEKIFLNPFDSLDNSTKYLDYLQSTLDDLITSNEEDKNDPLLEITNSLLKLTNSFTKPIFDLAKSQMKPETIIEEKKKILELIIQQLNKQEYKLNIYIPETDGYRETEKIIHKLSFLKLFTEWSMKQEDSELFKYYQFH